MKGKIIIIGNEILNGFTEDVNANFLIKILSKNNVSIENVVFIKDDINSIIWELENTNLVDYVFITGGLGPTSDDLTTKALSIYFNNKKYKKINNSIGTASGLWYTKNNTNYFSLPGVPSEMKLMIVDIVSLIFKKKSAKKFFFQVNTIGIIERKLSSLLSDFEKELPESCKMSYLPDNNIVKLRFYDSTGSINLFSDLNLKLKKIIGNHIFSYDQEPLEQRIVFELIKKKIKIAISESCTGGQVSKMITSIPGSSKVFLGSIVAYSEKVKKGILRVKPETIINYTAVSEQVVIEMAQSVRMKFNSDFGLATSGYMGPFDKNTDKIAWVCVASGNKVITKKINLKSNRGNNILITARIVLNELRKEIL